MSTDFSKINATGLTDEGTYAPDNLHDRDTLTEMGVVVSGAGVLARGSVLGKITKAGATSAAKSGGNTGNGTLTLDVTAPIGAKVKTGVYTARCITAAANGGTFIVLDPDGFSLGQVLVGATFANDLKFVIADGATDFIVGDGFDITVAAGSNKYKLSAAAAVDGSEEPDVILLEPVDATSADKGAAVATRGRFNQGALVLGAGHTLASIKAGLRDKNINFERAIG